jgi:hypothetical protein
MAYTAAFSASLGDTAYLPGNKDIDSQESDLFDVDGDSSIDEPFDTIMEGGIITNLQYVSRYTLAGEEPWEKHIDDSQEKDVVNNAEAINSNDGMVVRSPAKVTRKATTSLGISQVALQGQCDLVKGLIRDWVEKRGTEELPLNLVALAECVGIELTQHPPLARIDKINAIRLAPREKNSRKLHRKWSSLVSGLSCPAHGPG